MNDPSPLRQLVGVVERELTPPLQKLCRSGPFAIVVTAGLRTERSANAMLTRLVGRALHAVNLPTYQDVNRVRHLVAELDQDVRRLHRSLDSNLDSNLDTDLDDRKDFSNGPRAAAG